MKLWLSLVLFALPSRADTIIFRDGDASMNGAVTYRDGKFEVKGNWQGKSAVVGPIAGILVKAVRFNSLEDNASAPPAYPKPRGNPPITCEVVLAKSSKPRAGILESIDSASIRIGGAGVDKKRVTLLRVIE